jgi:GAF domain-containing protein
LTNIEAEAIVNSDNGDENYFVTPLALRGNDRIGSVWISDDSAKPVSEDDKVFIEQIAEQVALALESARLFTQTQRALAETDALYTIISELNAARDYNAILSVLAQRTILATADQSVVMFVFDHALSKNNIPEWIIPVAQHSKTDIRLAEKYPLNAFEVTPNTLFTNAPVVLEKVMEDGRLDRITQTLFHDIFNANSSVILPMLLGDQSLGFILGNFGENRVFSEAEVQRLSTIASQVAIAVQGMQLLEQTLARARREQLLREVTNQINSASGTDEILRRAAEQVGKAIKRPVFVYLGNTPDRFMAKAGEVDHGNNGA